jgi:hypothetical protein
VAQRICELQSAEERDSRGSRIVKFLGAEILVDALQSIRWEHAPRGLVD